MTGSMGLASSIGIGVALETRRTTAVADGDGSLLMNPVGLIAAGAMADLKLVHIVLDDGLYASTGGQAVPSARANLCRLANASGYSHVMSTARVGEFSGYPVFGRHTAPPGLGTPSGLAASTPAPPGRNPHGPVLAVEADQWRNFIAEVKAGQHDLT